MDAIVRLDGGAGGRGRKWPLILVALCIAASLQPHVQLTTGDQAACGSQAGGAVCSDGSCCSEYGYCGSSAAYCGTGCQSDCVISGNTTVQCGTTLLCSDSNDCCSSYGYCGTGDGYCAGGCQSGSCISQFAPYASPVSSGSGSSVGVYVGIAVGVVAAVVLVLLSILFVRRKRRHGQRNKLQAPDEETGSKSFEDYDSLQLPVKLAHSASGVSFGIKFSYATLSVSTDGFNKELGRGAFGVVYKGRLKDETDIAVKKLLDNERGLKDFEAEVKTLGSINHANLVALFGFCIERKQPFLVYEYVPNGSLNAWIFEKDKSDKQFVMPWNRRVDIVKGTAKGLAYLHEDLQIGQAIIHLDIKPENILLDEHFVPKVADFGMAKLIGSKKTQTLVSGGTVGYMAPEVFVGAATPSMDVYSFGMVLLEVLSGRRHLDTLQPKDSVYLPSWAARKVRDGEELTVIDPLLKEDEINGEVARRLIVVGLLCLQRDPDERPQMSTVLRMIEGVISPWGIPTSLQLELEMTERLVTNRRLFGSGTTDSSVPLIELSSKSSTEELPKEGRNGPRRESLRPLLYDSSSLERHDNLEHSLTFQSRGNHTA